MTNSRLTHSCSGAGGDERSGRVLGYLMEIGSKPYLEMLSKWIYEGELR